MRSIYCLLALPILFLCSVVFGVDVPIHAPEGDPLVTLMSLIASWKTVSPLALGSMGITFAVQMLKKFVPNFIYLRTVVAILGVAYGVIVAMVQGMGVLEALVTALVVSGGAIAIYESLKPAMRRIGIEK